MKKKIVSLVLALIMLMSFVGCGVSTTDESSTTTKAGTTKAKTPAELEIAEPVNLICYVPGDLPVDLPVVMEQIAPILKERINATVEFSGVPWGDFDTKYPLILASGETCDLIFTADWSFYNEFVNKNALAPLDDFLADYAPDVLKLMSADFIQSARIDGKLYMIPSNFLSFNSQGYIARGDLMDKYDIKDIKNYKDFLAYLRAIKGESGMTPFDAMPDDSFIFTFQQENRDRIVALKPKTYGYFLVNVDGSVTSALDDAAVVEFIQEARKAYNDGLWSKSILSNQVVPRDTFDNGRAGAYLWNVYNADSARATAIEKGLNWDVRFYQAGRDLPIQLLSAKQSGMSIPFSSKHAKRAVMLLNEVNKDFELWKLFTFGIKGVHYDINDKNERVLPAGMGPDDIMYKVGEWAFCWGTNVTDYHYYYDDPTRSDTQKAIVESAKTNGLFNSLDKYGFAFNAENVKTEEAAVTAAINKYFLPLIWGTLDTETGITTCREKLNAAGFETVRAEYEKQIKDFMAENNLETLFD